MSMADESGRGGEESGRGGPPTDGGGVSPPIAGQDAEAPETDPIEEALRLRRKAADLASFALRQEGNGYRDRMALTRELRRRADLLIHRATQGDPLR